MILYEYDIMENQSSEQGIYARINPAFVGSHADVTKKSFFIPMIICIIIIICLILVLVWVLTRSITVKSSRTVIGVSANNR